MPNPLVDTSSPAPQVPELVRTLQHEQLADLLKNDDPSTLDDSTEAGEHALVQHIKNNIWHPSIDAEEEALNPNFIAR